MVVGQQEIVDELLTPLNDLLYDIETQHTQRVQDTETFIQKLRMTLLILAIHLLHTKALQLQILLISFSQNLFKLHDLRDTAFPSNDSLDRILNWCSLILKIFNFFDDDW